MSNQNYNIQHFFITMDMLPLEGEHIRNNNNQNTLWYLRDRLFHVLFERATIAYAATFTQRFRKFVEIVFLIFAVISLCTLAYIHVTFVQVPVNCLEKETENWSREGILRVEISFQESVTEPVDISKYCNNMSPPPIKNIPKFTEEQKRPMKLLEKDDLHKPVDKVPELIVEDTFQDHVLDAEKTPEFINRTFEFKDSVSDPDCLSPLRTILSDMEMFTNTVWTQEEYVIEYSLEYGFLRLSPAARQNTSVKIHTVTLDPLKDQCFGNQFSQFLLKYVVGYGDVLMSSLRYLVDKDDCKGFVRNVITGDQYRFVDKSTTWTAYFSAAFIMMVFTLSISMLLRYSHHQIFMFIIELLHVFEFNTSVSFPAAPLLTVVLALVGMEAIMSEFFNDSTTAFYIILIVWIADQYDTICCHTPVTKRHWLRFFYLYHFAFYAYHYRFNGQYSSLALATSWLFIQHSMLYFFHRYELPAVLEANEPSMQHEPESSPDVENNPTVSEAAVPQGDGTSSTPNQGRGSPTSQNNQDSPDSSQAAPNENTHDENSPSLSPVSAVTREKVTSKQTKDSLQSTQCNIVS